MSRSFSLACAILIACSCAGVARAESIDGRVTQVTLPLEDVQVRYVEAKGAFFVELDARTASVGGTRLFVGDGTVALELEAHPTDGLRFQGRPDLLGNGSVIAKYSVIEVLPGWRRASDLQPGDVYVRLRGATLRLPQE